MTLPQNSIPQQPAHYLSESPMHAEIFNSDLLAIAVVDAHCNFLSINERFCKLFKIESIEYLGKPLCNLFTSLSETDCAALTGNRNIANKTNPTNSILLAYTNTSGSEAKIKITSDHIKFGEASASFIVAQDITAEILNTDAKITAINIPRAQQSSNKDLVWFVDPAFNLISANAAFYQSMELNYGVKCRTGESLLRANSFPAEVLDFWRASYESVLKGVDFKEEIYLPGTPVLDAAWVEVSFNLIYSDGKIVGIACHSRDITKRKIAEKLLTENELRLAEAQEVAKMGNWETNLTNLSVVWSDKTYSIFGIQAGKKEVFHQDFLAFVHPEDREKVNNAFTDSFCSDGIKSIEHRIITASGETKDVEQRWRVYFSTDNIALRAVGTCQDISVRKNAERRMLESDLLYRSLIAQASDTICIVDSSMHFIDINPSGCSALGYAKEELGGTHIKNVLFNEDLLANPLRLADLEAGITVTNERRIKCKDGTAILVELTGKVLEDGKIIFFGRDITERKATERYLKQSNERYNLISQLTNDMVWDWDLTTDKVYRNKEGWRKIFRCAPDKIINGDIMDWDERVHPEDVECTKMVSQKILISAANFFELECRVRRDDGSYAFIHDKGQIIRDEQGKAVRLIGATQDISERKEAALKLEKSETRFRLLVQNSSDLVNIVTGRGYCLYSSPALTEILGYEPESMLGVNIFSLLHPHDLEKFKDQFRLEKHQKNFEILPFRVRTNNGDWRWLETRVTDMSDSPDLGGFVFNSRDVTERVVAAEEIKKLSLIARETTNAVIITNPVGEVLWVNQAFTRMTEYTLADVEGRKLAQFLQGPETNPVTVRYMHQKIEKQLPYECDIINYTKSGKQYWLRVQCQPRFDKDGKLEAFFAIQTDISNQKETERILKNSEEQYRHLFNNNPASIIIWDLETFKILEVNQTAQDLYGYARSEFISKSVLDLRTQEAQARLKEFAECAKKQPDYKLVLNWKHLNKKGEEMSVNISSHRINYNGRSVILAMGTDVTEKLQLEKLLEQERHARHREITKAVISAQENERHELGRELHDNINQILASSLLYLGLAKTVGLEETTFINKADELVQSAIVEVRNLSHSLIPPSLNDSELLEALSRVMDTARLSGKLQIDLEAPGFDETKVPDNLKLTLFRIAQEQLSNILKHACATYVKVKVLLQENNLQLVIIDNGTGFNTSRKHSGVGLMNIKTRVALFDGKISIISSPGAGCELTVTFPIMPAK